MMSAIDDDDFMERYKAAWDEGNLRWLDVDITPIYKMMGGEPEGGSTSALSGIFGTR